MIQEVPSRRATGNGSVVDSLAVAFPGAVTKGNLLVAGGAVYSGITAVVATDTLGTTYQVFLGADTGTGAKPFLAIGLAPASGPNTITVNPNGASNYIAFAIDEFSGVADGFTVATDGGGATGSTTTPTIAMTPSIMAALLLGVGTMGQGGSVSWTNGADYTQIGEWGGTLNDFNFEFRRVIDVQPYNVDWTLSGAPTINWSVYALAIRPAGPTTIRVPLPPPQGLSIGDPMLLADTNDSLELVTTAAVALDVCAKWIDRSGTTDTPGKSLSAITTATTTTIVAAPAASTFRNIIELTARNKGAAAQGATLRFNDNGTTYELFSCILQPSETLAYKEGAWFVHDTTGAVKANSLSQLQVKVLSGDQTMSSTTPVEATGLTVPTTVGAHAFQYLLRMRSAATTTGHKFDVNHDGTVTSMNFVVRWLTAASAAADDVPDQDHTAAPGGVVSGFSARGIGTTGTGQTTDVDTANADVLYLIEGQFECSVAGNLELWFGAEAAASITLMSGSMLLLFKE